MNTDAKQHLNPAQVAMQEFGGCRKLADLLGLSPSTVSRWARSRAKKRMEGAIPAWVQPKILELAKDYGVNLTAEDLIYGRTQHPTA